MTELLSALLIALENRLPERVARGETSVDQFFDCEGFSLVELSRDIEQVVSQHSDWKALLGQNENDPRFVFSDSQLLNELIAIVSSESENNAVMMSAGGLGRNLQLTNLAAVRNSLSKTNRSLDPSRFERADSLTATDLRSDFKESSDAPRMGTSDTGTQQIDSKHEQEIHDYWRLYTAGRKELAKATLKTIEVSLAKKIVHYQIERFTSGFTKAKSEDGRNHYWTQKGPSSGSAFGDNWVDKSISFGHKRNWATASIGKQTNRSGNSVDFIQVGKGDKKDSSFLTIEDYDAGNKSEGYGTYNLGTPGGDNPEIANNRADGYAITYDVTTKKWQDNYSIYTTGDSIDFSHQEWKKGKLKSSSTRSIPFTTVLERTNAYQRDENLVYKYKHDQLLPEALKKKFGKVLALSDLAYNMKRRVAIEKEYWPETYSDIITVTKKGDWGKAYQYNQGLTHVPTKLRTHNQKRDAKALRMFYGAQLAVNRSVKYAWDNAKSVFKRALSDGLSEKQAKKIGALTYVSDLVLFDSFIASSYLSEIATSKVSKLAGAEGRVPLRGVKPEARLP